MRIIVGISGASGAIYGVRLLEVLHQLQEVETHLVITNPARETIEWELGRSVASVEALAHKVYDINDVGAAIASGSYRTEGMVVAPCSIRTLSAIAHSYTNNLLVRAADVVLKERRRLVLLVRETPLHLGHLRLMAQVAEVGGIILPPIPSFYHKPKTIDDIVNHTIGRVLDQMGIPVELYNRWQGLASPEPTQT